MTRMMHSLVTECYKRIDPHCTPRRHEATDDSGKSEDYSGDNQCERIRWGHLDKHRLKNPRERKAASQTDGKANEQLRDALLENEHENSFGGRAERHTDADFLSPLAHRV